MDKSEEEMSFYNMIFGVNEMAPLLLKMLGIEKSEIPRFRDAFLAEGKIAVYCRSGGGNREHWDLEQDRGEGCDCTGCTITYSVPALEYYSFDRDDEFDNTYATIFFDYPEEWREMLVKLNKNDKWEPDKRWLEKLESLKT